MIIAGVYTSLRMHEVPFNRKKYTAFLAPFNSHKSILPIGGYEQTDYTLHKVHSIFGLFLEECKKLFDRLAVIRKSSQFDVGRGILRVELHISISLKTSLEHTLCTSRSIIGSGLFGPVLNFFDQSSVRQFVVQLVENRRENGKDWTAK